VKIPGWEDRNSQDLGLEKLMKRLVLALLGLVLAVTTTVLPAAAQDSYTIKSGDVLRIEVLEDPSLNRSTLVLPDGNIALPLAGTLRASGLTLEQLQAAVAARMAPNFATTPTVYVGLDALAAPRPVTGTAAAAPMLDVYVIGEAAKPGKFQVKPGTTVLQFLAEIGGFSKFAATKRIQLRRTVAGVETTYLVNYKAIEAGAAGTGLGTIAAGDVFIIPQRHLFE
jgi:polysaccharide export outer membrane protein